MEIVLNIYNLLSRWPVAGPPAPCRTFGAAANKLSGARRLRHWGGGPQAIYLFPRELVYYGEVEVATTAGAATAAELPALRRRHCEAAAVIHRQAVG